MDQALTKDGANVLRIDVANEQTSLPIDEERLRSAVTMVLQRASIEDAQISVAVVDDATIRRLNRDFLHHDYPTDVLSFVLDETDGRLEGEVVVGAETARREAAHYGWSAEDELLLYAIHGTLHLVGYQDGTAEQRATMRRQEQECLAPWGLVPRWDEVRTHGAAEHPDSNSE